MQTIIDNLQEKFTAAQFTAFMSKGELQFAKCNLFRLMQQLELLTSDFCEQGDIVSRDAIQDVLYALREEELPKVGCNEHFDVLMKTLVYDILVIRFNFTGRNTEKDNCNSVNATNYIHSKLSKI